MHGFVVDYRNSLVFKHFGEFVPHFYNVVICVLRSVGIACLIFAVRLVCLGRMCVHNQHKRLTVGFRKRRFFAQQALHVNFIVGFIFYLQIFRHHFCFFDVRFLHRIFIFRSRGRRCVGDLYFGGFFCLDVRKSVAQKTFLRKISSADVFYRGGSGFYGNTSVGFRHIHHRRGKRAFLNIKIKMKRGKIQNKNRQKQKNTCINTRNFKALRLFCISVFHSLPSIILYLCRISPVYALYKFSVSL